MDTHDVLNKLTQILNQEKLDCTLANPNDKKGPLLLYLGTDTQERNRIVEISVTRQEMKQTIDTSKETIPDFYQITFHFTFPSRFADYTLSDISSLVFLLNRLIELPGFEVNEVENSVYYRYVWLTTEAGMHPKIVLGIVGILMFLFDSFTEALESVGNGKLTLHELLKKMDDLLEKLKKSSTLN
jgi:hypothetical protein